MFYYLYRVTNTVNNRFYIGVRKCKKNPADDLYLGSGTVIKEAVARYGRLSFVKEILETFDNLNSMYSREAEIVNSEFLLNPLVYNIALGGRGGDRFSMHPDKETYRKKLSDGNRAHKQSLSREERQEKYGLPGERNGFFNKQHSTETKSRLSNWHQNNSPTRNTAWYYNPKTNQKIRTNCPTSDLIKGYPPGTHPNLFRNGHSDQTKEHIRLARNKKVYLVRDLTSNKETRVRFLKEWCKENELSYQMTLYYWKKNQPVSNFLLVQINED